MLSMNSIFKEPFNNLLTKNRTFIMGCAMIVVMLFHQQFIVGNILLNFFRLCGRWGVDIFLFVSGFGIVNSLHNNSIGKYYKNRINRLLVPCLLVGVCKCILVQVGFISYTGFLLTLTNLGLWYIYAIIVYYVLAPVFKLIVQKSQYAILYICVICAILSLKQFEESFLYLIPKFRWLIERLPVFILGMHIAVYPPKTQIKNYLWGIIPFVLCMLLRMQKDYFITYLILLLAVPMLCIISSLFARILDKIKLRGVVEYFGKTSLELYLWHEFIFLNVAKDAMFVELHASAKFIIAFAISILFAHLTYLLKKRIPFILK